jgi:flagellar biogenesis protein FliO
MAKGFEPGGLAGWALQAFARGRAGIAARKNERELTVVETLSLGGKRQLALVECGGKKFLVGMGGDSVDAIEPLEMQTGPVKKTALRVMGAGF